MAENKSRGNKSGNSGRQTGKENTGRRSTDQNLRSNTSTRKSDQSARKNRSEDQAIGKEQKSGRPSLEWEEEE